ncbi:MAG TPA: hypothetical protein VMW38_04280 [Terriglobia bacterium]|nr:hypothetical protein [Terriglobia bacterium]
MMRSYDLQIVPVCNWKFLAAATVDGHYHVLGTFSSRELAQISFDHWKESREKISLHDARPDIEWNEPTPLIGSVLRGVISPAEVFPGSCYVEDEDLGPPSVMSEEGIKELARKLQLSPKVVWESATPISDEELRSLGVL